jgi:hypothetical protein
MASTERLETGPPGLHPDPPPDLGSSPLPLKITSEPWLRGYPAGRDPIYFGRTGRHRFDAPRGEFGTLYVGQDAHCVFIETFGHRTGELDFVTSEALESRALARIEPRRPLRLVDLSGSGLARLRADARLSSGAISVAQKWALALFVHPDRPDGIYYRSRHDPDRFCAAVFDRVGRVLASTILGSFADPANERLLGEILDTYGIGLIDA